MNPITSTGEMEMARQSDLDRDVDTLAIVKDHVRILQLRLHEASAKVETERAVDAVADLSNQIMDLMSDFDAQLARLTYEANAAERDLENQHLRDLRSDYYAGLVNYRAAE